MIRVLSITPNDLHGYSTWLGDMEDGRKVFVFLAHNVLHVNVLGATEEECSTVRKVVECPGGQMLTEEMMKQVDMELVPGSAPVA